MSQELFYTSAPRGLQPGSRGFCTVAATTGMPAALMEKLESLSGYRPLFPPLDGKSGLNPVVYSHLRLALGAKTYSLLSRVCSAGLDYTERTNKFAHHVVLENGELPPGGPAWLMRQPGFMEVAWDGQVGMLVTGRVPPSGDSSPSVCKAWENLTGDAGWAGVVAEAFTKNSGRLIYLIFEPGMEVLPLIDEVLSLLPAEQRWQVSFSTYFTGLPQGVHCLWRSVPAGSAEAKNASRLPDALILNLCRPLGEATGGALVEQARTGIRPQALQSELPDLGLTRESLRERKSGAEFRSREIGSPKHQAGFGARVSEQLPASPTGLREGLGAPPLHLREQAKTDSRKGESGVWLIGFSLGAAVGILVTLMLGTGLWFFGGYELVRSADRAKHEGGELVANNDGGSQLEASSSQPKNPKVVADSSNSQKKSEPPVRNPSTTALSEPKAALKVQSGSPKNAPSKPKQPNGAGPRRLGSADIIYYSKLPRRLPDGDEWRPISENLGFGAEIQPNLQLCGPGQFSTKQKQRGRSSLTVMCKTTEAGVGQVDLDLAEFEIKNGVLQFRWLDKNESAVKAARSSLKQSILEIGAANKLYVALRKPVQEIQPGIRIQQTPLSYRFPLKWDEDQGSPRPISPIYLDSVQIALGGAEPLSLQRKPGNPDSTELAWHSDAHNAQPKDSKLKVDAVSVKVLSKGEQDEIVVELTQTRRKEDSKEPAPRAAVTNQVSHVLKALSAIEMPYNQLIEEVGRKLHLPEFSAARDVKPAPSAPQSDQVPDKLTLKALVLYVKIKDVPVDVYRVKGK